MARGGGPASASAGAPGLSPALHFGDPLTTQFAKALPLLKEKKKREREQNIPELLVHCLLVCEGFPLSHLNLKQGF